MITYAVRALREAGAGPILAVLGHGGERVEEALASMAQDCPHQASKEAPKGEAPQGSVVPVYQAEPLGAGHALLAALPKLHGCLESGIKDCLVVCGDMPLLTGRTLAGLREARADAGAAAAVLTAPATGPSSPFAPSTGPSGSSPPADAGGEGAYAFDMAWLIKALESLAPADAQDCRLADVMDGLAKQGGASMAYPAPETAELLDVNDRVQLARAQDLLRRRILERHMLGGVTVEEPAATIIGPLAEIGMDTVIETGCQIFGRTVIGEGCVIGPRSRITDCRIGSGATVNQTTAAECEIGDNCDVGPYTYLRPGCVLAKGVKAGTFVEMKKAIIDIGAKVPHLSYIGDCTIGKAANIGAGTITCNYDGVHKHQTVIGDGAFIGSNSNLVAPVTVGDKAYTAAGSTITKDVPEDALGVARGKQSNIIGWRRRQQ